MSNVTGILHEINKVDYIKQRLVDQLTGPVRWEKGVIWLISHMPGHFVELAPGRVLSGLMKRIDRSIKVENHAEPPPPSEPEVEVRRNPDSIGA
jgi:[acyl-carrier-protein] S-malonyltransferase